MLASITPLGERGRQATWGVTVAAFLGGALAAGAGAGALAGAFGSVVLPGTLDTRVRLAALAAAALVAIALDAGPQRVPGPRRQVNERWLDEFRGWVYGLGFGAQLGLGITTVVSSAATYVALTVAFLTAGSGRGAIVVGSYGLVRGLTPLAAARVRTPQQLIALHRRLARWQRPIGRVGLATLTAIVLLSVAGSLA
jgi:hypothetical protein